jgi:hypothetical protein
VPIWGYSEVSNLDYYSDRISEGRRDMELFEWLVVILLGLILITQWTTRLKGETLGQLHVLLKSLDSHVENIDTYQTKMFESYETNFGTERMYQRVEVKNYNDLRR